ncbi:hypothetical protein P3W45_001680 [Vairimorpha bombi]|jgi:hypothetical protein
MFIFQRQLYLFDQKSFINPKYVYEIRPGLSLNIFGTGSDTDCIIFLGNVIDYNMTKQLSLIIQNYIQFNVISYNMGEYSEKQIKNELYEIGTYLNTRKKKSFGVGISFGCSSLIYLSTMLNFEKIVLINPFYSLRRIADERMLGILLVDTFDNTIIKQVDCYITLLYSEYDEVISNNHSKDLSRLNKNINLICVPEADHNSILHGEVSIYENLIRYLK